MTRTVIESKTKTVIIGFDEPFCVIGERINPTGRKKLAAELEAGNFETVIRDALEQVACGATVLDINSGAVFTNKMAEDPRYADNNFVEPPLMKALIEIVQQTVDVPLCIDSSVPGALLSLIHILSRAGARTEHGTARESGQMPDVIIVYWRDIPAQVIVGKGRRGLKVQLSERFEQAIDRCAMKIGAKDADAYLAEWRKAAPYEVEGEHCLLYTSRCV